MKPSLKSCVLGAVIVLVLGAATYVENTGIVIHHPVTGAVTFSINGTNGTAYGAFSGNGSSLTNAANWHANGTGSDLAGTATADAVVATNSLTVKGADLVTLLTNKVLKAGDVMTGTLTAPEVDAAELFTGSFKLYRSALTPIDAGTQLNFASTNRYWSCTLTGAVTWTTAGLAAGKHANVMVSNTQATNCAITFPAWIFIGYKPTYISAGKHGDIYLKSTGTTDAEVWAFYGEEQ